MAKPKTLDANLNIKIKLELREELRAEAERRGLNLADLVRLVLRQWLDDGAKLK